MGVDVRCLLLEYVVPCTMRDVAGVSACGSGGALLVVEKVLACSLDAHQHAAIAHELRIRQQLHQLRVHALEANHRASGRG